MYGPLPPGVTVMLPLPAPLQVGITTKLPSVMAEPAATDTLTVPLLHPAALVTTTVCAPDPTPLNVYGNVPDTAAPPSRVILYVPDPPTGSGTVIDPLDAPLQLVAVADALAANAGPAATVTLVVLVQPTALVTVIAYTPDNKLLNVCVGAGSGIGAPALIV